MIQSLIVLVTTVIVTNTILNHGSTDPLPTTLPEPVAFPPMEIRQIAHAMDLGCDVSDEALDKLSRYIEENQTEWNAWCELERRRADR